MNGLVFLVVATVVAAGPGSRRQIQERVGDGGFNPGAQKSLTYRSKSGLVVRLVVSRTEALRLAFSGPGRPESVLELPDEIVQVDRIAPAAGSYVALFGMVNGAVHEVVIVDPGGRHMVDRFLCYNPALSPDGESIAFVKFYPPHFDPGVSDLVMVYDVAKGKAKNRPHEAGVDELIDVGSPVYPAGIQTQSPNDGLPESQANSVTSPFFWAADSSRFAFTVRHAPWQASEGHKARGTELNLILARRERKSGRWNTVSMTAAMCGEGGRACDESASGIEFGKTTLGVQFLAGKLPPIRVAYDQMHESRPPPGSIPGH